MLGYWRRPEETRAVILTDPLTGHRCLRTGDLFRSDADGYLYFEGRRDDMIKSGGRKVAPREVEMVIEELSGVAEVSVVGIPDLILGQTVKAFVVLLPGYGYESHAILAHCRARLESHQIPASIEIRSTLPHGENGKIDRHLLAAMDAAPAAEFAEVARISGA
jgi:acyl-CoA synthetase (AMP-forming)/AMP-acid ligase II